MDYERYGYTNVLNLKLLYVMKGFYEGLQYTTPIIVSACLL
jgi:hypothetical protein